MIQNKYRLDIHRSSYGNYSIKHHSRVPGNMSYYTDFDYGFYGLYDPGTLIAKDPDGSYLYEAIYEIEPINRVSNIWYGDIKCVSDTCIRNKNMSLSKNGYVYTINGGQQYGNTQSKEYISSI